MPPQTVTGSALSVAANATSVEQLSGSLLETAPATGAIQLYAKASATGLNMSFSADGTTTIDDQVIPYTGTAGSITRQDNLINAFGVTMGSRLQLRFRNTTGSAITTDFLVDFQG